MLRGEKNGSFPRPVVSHPLLPPPPRFLSSLQPNEISSRTEMRTDSREGDRKMEKGKTRESNARVGEREIPFDQLRLINGVGGGIVDGERPRGRGRVGGTERRGKLWASRALWVYVIKNVNICRRLVIGCKYGGRARCRDQMGRSGPRSSFVSLFIGMHDRARAVPKPTLPVEAPRGRARSSSPRFILIRSRLVSELVLPHIRDILISNSVELRKATETGHAFSLLDIRRVSHHKGISLH